MDLYFFFLFLCIATVVFIFIGMRQGSGSSPQTQATSATSAANQQMADDIRMTKTSRVVDEVAILDELSQDMPTFRQYCELVGTSQKTGGVVAPYSRREVAYYEIRCYRIENHGAGDVETLVAHERSFDPFYFTDDSCDTPVYVNLESFGDNVMLVNSTNHIEGPNSDFAKAVGNASATSASTGTSGVTAIVGRLASGVVHGFDRVREVVRQALPGLVAQPALAGAAASGQTMPMRGISFAEGGRSAGSSSARKAMKSNMAGRSSQARGGSAGGRSGGSAAGFSSGHGSNRPSSSRPSTPGSQQRQTTVTFNFGMPNGLGTFLGSGRPVGGYSSVPRPMPRPYHQPYPTHTYRRTNAGDVISDMITGMVLSSVLDSMANSTTTTTTTRPQSTFRGYRLVEDVVPLGSPVYCIGELYHHGTDVYMGRSLATDYPTSYFATKPEVEVLATLGK